MTVCCRMFLRRGYSVAGISVSHEQRTYRIDDRGSSAAKRGGGLSEFRCLFASFTRRFYTRERDGREGCIRLREKAGENMGRDRGVCADGSG